MPNARVAVRINTEEALPVQVFMIIAVTFVLLF